MSDLRTIAVLGTGTIGEPVARNLGRAGFAVRAWNRTRAKAEPLAADGVTIAGSPAEAVAGADVFLTLLSDGDAVEDVVARHGAAESARESAVWIQSSTVGLAATERLEALADEHGLVFVDAPVLGTREPAEKGELVVFASGPESASPPCAIIASGSRRAEPTRWTTWSRVVSGVTPRSVTAECAECPSA